MKVYFATDHAGFELKEKLLVFVSDKLGYEVEDMGAHTLNTNDDYPDFVAEAARAVSEDPENSRAIVLGASGQGEAIVANRFSGVRAAVFYGTSSATQVDIEGEDLDIVTSTRKHNNTNVLSLGARFVTEEEAQKAVAAWLAAEFEGEERHVRRIRKIDTAVHR